MHYIRPINKSDLDALMSLLDESQSGLTTLPKDRDHLRRRIDDSLRAFDEKIHRPGGEQYLFALVDADNEKIIGTSGICSKVGGFQPFYTYRIQTEEFADPDLKIKKTVKVLHLVANHDGPSEICSLYIGPRYRAKGLGRLLSLSRFLFMAEFPHRFDTKVISELRGFTDEKGRSPFWDCVGKIFFEIEFAHADFLTGLGQKSFIKNLMPRYPIYCAMLPDSVQRVIGAVHPNTEPALHLLQKEGFEYENEVDLFDAGPTVTVELHKIRSVQQSVRAVFSGTTDKLPPSSQGHIITNAGLDFRACYGEVLTQEDGSVVLDPQIARLLKLEVGDEVRFA